MGWIYGIMGETQITESSILGQVIPISEYMSYPSAFTVHNTIMDLHITRKYEQMIIQYMFLQYNTISTLLHLHTFYSIEQYIVQ